MVTSVTWLGTHTGDLGKGHGQGPRQRWVSELPLASGRQEDRRLGTTTGSVKVLLFDISGSQTTGQSQTLSPGSHMCTPFEGFGRF